MGDFTKQLIQRRMLKRPGGPPVDLDELRKQTSQGALEALLSPESASAIGTLAPAVATEVGTLLVSLGDALARVVPPALRLDIKAVEGGWVLEVMNQGEQVYARSMAAKPQALCQLAVEGVGTWAHSDADTHEDKELKEKVYRRWAHELAKKSVELEEWLAE